MKKEPKSDIGSGGGQMEREMSPLTALIKSNLDRLNRGKYDVKQGLFYVPHICAGNSSQRRKRIRETRRKDAVKAC